MANFSITVEQWKVLPSNNNYLISDKGRIYSKKTKAFIFGSLTSKGYVRAIIRIDEKVKETRVHGLVLEAFVGVRPYKYDINHIDGIKTNNALSNLEYCTPSENTKHAYRIGLIKKKLSKEKICEIRNMLRTTNLLQSDIANMYNVNQSVISRIKSNRIWVS